MLDPLEKVKIIGFEIATWLIIGLEEKTFCAYLSCHWFLTMDVGTSWGYETYQIF
jgi:hypothetical protein